LYAIGAGSQVGAVDADSTYPAQAEVLALKDKINPLNPSAEAIGSICPGKSKPSLVVISYNANSIQQKLMALGVNVVVQSAPSTLNGAYAQIAQLGQLSGHSSEAATLTSSMKKAIKAAIASIPAHPSKKLTVFYEVGVKPYYSLTSQTFVGSLLKSLGTVNIADEVATSADAGYPSLSAEYILSSNPKLIFTADGQTKSQVSARTGFKTVSAAAHGAVASLNPNVASEWGPQLPELVKSLASAVRAALNNKMLWN
jgi:iron complex transport system substrate-binding protein